MSSINIEDVDTLVYLSESDWTKIIESNHTFSPVLVKLLIDIIKSYKHAINHIITGRLKGYTIECPHCGYDYDIEVQELNYNKMTKCTNCDNVYFQNQSIKDILCREEQE
jgi:predicted Zn finger-like uncharacterized protein